MKVLHLTMCDPFSIHLGADLLQGSPKLYKDDTNYKFELLCPSSKPGNHFKDNLSGFNITRVSTFGSLFNIPLSPMYFFMAYIMSRKADIVHIHSPNIYAEILCLLLPKDTKIVLSYHRDIYVNPILKTLLKPILYYCMKKVKKIIVPTSSHITQSKILTKFKNKCKIVSYGVHEINIDKNENIIKKVFELKNIYADFTLFVGDLVKENGIDYLINAHTKIANKLIIIGTGSEKENLKKIILTHKLENKVFIINESMDKESISAFYHACNIFCLPSVSSTQRIDLNQLYAMSCAKPVITTKVHSDRSVLGIENFSSVLVEPMNSNELSIKINQLFRNENLARRLGSNGQKSFRKFFTFEKMIKDHLKCYQAIVKGSKNYRSPHKKQVA